MKLLPAILFFLFCTGIAEAGAETQINQQLQHGGITHLPAGTYTLTDSIVLQNDCVLEGESGTVLTIPDHAGWQDWQPLILGNGVHNVTIRNIEVDANSNGNSDKPHGQGYYNIVHCSDCDSVTVCNCNFANSLGDGFRTDSCTNLKFYNNTVCKMGHEGAYFIRSQNIQAYNNRITTRTNSALRLWNCQHVRFYSNTIDAQLDSLGGNPGIQIEDSTGTMQDIEVCDNILCKTWGAGIWLISYDQGAGNNQGILIHHNLYYKVGQSYNIQYTGGIVNDGCKGTQVYNNVFDGNKNDAFRNQEGGQGTQIHDNIFTDALPHTAISQSGSGFAIANLAASDLSISNNCFFNNACGNLYQCSSSGDDAQDPKIHNTSSGWTWTGSTWTCAEVPPLALGSIAPTTTRGTIDHDTHEFNSIFDILSMNITQNITSEDVHRQNVINVHESAVKTVNDKGLFRPYTLLLSGLVGIFVFATYRIFQGMIL